MSSWFASRDSSVTTLYSDVHLQRLTFLESLFGDWKVQWDDILSRKDSAMEDGLYHLCVARYEARDPADLEAFLAFLGSRLVFLIDWNKARKRLRSLLGKNEVQEILKWAADEEIGHMGFLKCGGDELDLPGARAGGEGRVSARHAAPGPAVAGPSRGSSCSSSSARRLKDCARGRSCR